MKAIRITAWVAVALVAIAVGATLYLRQNAVVTATIGGPFTLTDQNGGTVTDASLRGHPSAMFFGYTFCPDVCPTTLSEASTWLQDLGPDADRLKIYFVTVDPERDDQKSIHDYLTAFDPRITGLTGTRAQIDQMLKAYRVYSRKVPRDDGSYLMDHTASVYLLDGTGRFTGIIDYQEQTESAMAKLRKLIAGS
ncbi:MAG TPA: SCO family protein [Bauldia sp.]|nr:SCO family protein [Bauldia sp.]